MDYLKKLISKLKEKKINIDDLIYLNELLKSNLPIRTSLDLIKNSNNKASIDSLILSLDKGDLIEGIIADYLPINIAKYMENLLKSLSFEESLELSLAFYNKNKENEKTLYKLISYPIILLFISLTALYLFDYYGLDSILNLMKTFNTDLSIFYGIRVIIRIVVTVFYFLFILITLLLLFFINKKRITLFYILLTKYLNSSIIKTYFTEDFISLFVITLKLGYKTKEALELLKTLHNKPLVSFLAFHLNDKLLDGDTLKEASDQNYYDETLSKFINIASYSTNFVGILSNYVELSRNKIKSKMKMLTNILQFSSYLVIGAVIVFIYQVLFLPMQAINTF